MNHQNLARPSAPDACVRARPFSRLAPALRASISRAGRGEASCGGALDSSQTRHLIPPSSVGQSMSGRRRGVEGWKPTSFLLKPMGGPATDAGTGERGSMKPAETSPTAAPAGAGDASSARQDARCRCQHAALRRIAEEKRCPCTGNIQLVRSGVWVVNCVSTHGTYFLDCDYWVTPFNKQNAYG